MGRLPSTRVLCFLNLQTMESPVCICFQQNICTLGFIRVFQRMSIRISFVLFVNSGLNMSYSSCQLGIPAPTRLEQQTLTSKVASSKLGDIVGFVSNRISNVQLSKKTLAFLSSPIV